MWEEDNMVSGVADRMPGTRKPEHLRTHEDREKNMHVKNEQ